MKSDIKNLEEQAMYEDADSQQPPKDIIAYNELRSCADLFRMYRTGILDIKPEFQRETVWPLTAQTRFIDSLVKQLPIPSMCFSLDYRTQKWMVIDGLQRMSTIVRFLSGESWKLSNLVDVEPDLSGKRVSEFHLRDSPLHRYLLKVENLSLPITVLRCDTSKKSHIDYLFTIFHRLNTGGMRLNNQEIRNCIFGGSFNDLLNELNENQLWLRLNKMKSPTGYRFAKQELILRFFAFLEGRDRYTGRLARFLNDYMRIDQDMGELRKHEMRHIFVETLDIVYNDVLEGKVSSKLGITLQEALLVGVAANLERTSGLPAEVLRSKFEELKQHEEFSEEKLSEGLAARTRVQTRLGVAVSIFGS